LHIISALFMWVEKYCWSFNRDFYLLMIWAIWKKELFDWLLTYGPTISQKTFGFTSCIMGKAWVVIARLVIGYVNTLT
jgi:hypothetical protein